MANLKVPEELKKGFTFLLSLTEDERKSLIAKLAENPVGSPLSVLAKSVENTVSCPQDEANQIVRVLVSLYKLKESEQKTAVEISEDVCAALKQEDAELTPKDSNWDNFKNSLKDLLSLDKSFGLTIKARDLLADYEKIYTSAKIITDIRPVLNSNLDTEYATFLLVHNLKIEYQTADGFKEIFIAMDSDDLDKLLKQVERAKKKESVIKNLIDEKHPFINP